MPTSSKERNAAPNTAKKLLRELRSRLHKPKKIGDLVDFLTRDIVANSSSMGYLAELAHSFGASSDGCSALVDYCCFVRKQVTNEGLGTGISIKTQARRAYAVLLWTLECFTRHYEPLQLYKQVVKCNVLPQLLDNIETALSALSDQALSQEEELMLLLSMRIILNTSSSPQSVGALKASAVPVLIRACQVSRGAANWVAHLLAVSVVRNLGRDDDLESVTAEMEAGLVDVMRTIGTNMVQSAHGTYEYEIDLASTAVLTISDLCAVIGAYAARPQCRQVMSNDPMLTFVVSDVLGMGSDRDKEACLELLVELADHQLFWPVIQLQVETLSEKLGRMRGGAVWKDMASRVLQKLRRISSSNDMSCIKAHAHHWYWSDRCCRFCDLTEKYLKLALTSLSERDVATLKSIMVNTDQTYRQFLLARRQHVAADPVLFTAVRDWDWAATVILESGDFNVDDPGSHPEGDVTHLASPLWLACAENKCHVVEKLLTHNANAASLTSWGSTSLHVTCAVGTLDTVKLLMREGALAVCEYQDAQGITPLMASTRNDDINICSYLLDLVGHTGLRDVRGNGVLHHAVLAKRVDIVQLLLKRETTDLFTRNKAGDDPARLACVLGHFNIVDIFLNTGLFDDTRRFEILQLLGSTAVLQGGAAYAAGLALWRQAMSWQLQPVKSSAVEYHPVFSKLVSTITNMHDLTRLEENPSKCCIQALDTRLGLLGPAHHSSISLILATGRRLANDNMDPGMIKVGLDLWKYGLELKHRHRGDGGVTDLLGDLALYLDTLRYVHSLGEEVFTYSEQFDDVLGLLDVVCQHASCAAAIASTRPVDRDGWLSTRRFWASLLHILDLGLRLANGELQREDLGNILQGFTQLDPHDPDGRSLVHMALRSFTAGYGAARGLILPSPCLISMLVDSGVDVNGRDDAGDTPLHTCCQQWLGSQCGDTLALLLVEHAKTLLSAGAHADMVNREGATCLAALEQMSIGFCSVREVHLTCLAARRAADVFGVAVCRASPVVPLGLFTFIQFHSAKFDERDELENGAFLIDEGIKVPCSVGEKSGSG